MPGPLLLSAAALLGLAVGSFLNVVIYRVPRGESVVSPGSHCPHCGSAVRSRQNIPVLSWILLRGKCADCRGPISGRYPLVEAGTAVLFVAVAAKFGLSWELPAYLYLAAISIALAVIDLDVKRLPNVIVLPSYVVAIALLVPAAVAEHSWAAIVRGAIAGIVLYGFFFFLTIFRMGMGDVKLAGLLGLYLGWLGWNAAVVGAFAGFLIGGVVGGLLWLTRLADRKSRFPYGPAMLAGAFVAVFAGPAIADWYLSLAVPGA